MTTDTVLNAHMTDLFNGIDGLPETRYTYGDTIIYYDGPKVFWLQTSDNRVLLVEAIADNDDDYQELAVFISPADLAMYLRGDVEFREAWTNAKSEDLYILHYPVDDEKKIWAAQAPTPLPEDMLPAPGARL